MQKSLALLCLIFLFSCSLQAQKKKLKAYINQNKQEINLAAVKEIKFESDFLNHQVYFFGFIHGSTTAQEVDFALLKNLNRQAGVKYYAPEVGPSFAFFLNQYLETGDEDLLETLVKLYERRVPQDAGLEWMEKWQKLYKFNKNLPTHKRIQIIGLDAPVAASLTLAHLAALLPKKTYSNTTLDSLQYFAKPAYSKGTGIWSGKPALASGKPWSYFFPNPAADHYDRIHNLIVEDKDQEVSKAFGRHWSQAQWLVQLADKKGREDIIFENFQKMALPLLEKGEKLYANFGYFHIQQGLVNGSESIAYKVKHQLNPKLSIASIQGLLAKSAVLKERKFKKEGEVIIRNVKFKGMVYNGYKHSRSWDGDSFLERVKGINLLKKHLKSDVTLIPLNKPNSPFDNTDVLAAFSRGGKKWKLTQGQHTTDYFQYVIFIQNATAISPLEELTD